MQFHIFNVKWDFDSVDFERELGCDDLDTSKVPTDFNISIDDRLLSRSKEELEDIISNSISETFGFCHFGFEYESIDDKEATIENWLSIFAV